MKNYLHRFGLRRTSSSWTGMSDLDDGAVGLRARTYLRFDEQDTCPYRDHPRQSGWLGRLSKLSHCSTQDAFALGALKRVQAQEWKRGTKSYPSECPRALEWRITFTQSTQIHHPFSPTRNLDGWQAVSVCRGTGAHLLTLSS